MAVTQPFNSPCDKIEKNSSAKRCKATMLFIGKPIVKAASIASITGHTTPFSGKSEKKVDLDIPQAKHSRSRYDPPAHQRKLDVINSRTRRNQ